MLLGAPKKAPAAFGLGFLLFSRQYFRRGGARGRLTFSRSSLPVDAAGRRGRSFPEEDALRDAAGMELLLLQGWSLAPEARIHTRRAIYGGGQLTLSAWPPARAGTETGGEFVPQSGARELPRRPFPLSLHSPCGAKPCGAADRNSGGVPPPRDPSSLPTMGRAALT